jgi:hypothetical protein
VVRPQAARKLRRMKLQLLLIGALMPVMGGCVLVCAVTLPDQPLMIQQARAYLDITSQPPHVREALAQHLPIIAGSLSSLLSLLAASAYMVCKKIGGVPYFMSKLLAMLAWVIFVYVSSYGHMPSRVNIIRGARPPHPRPSAGGGGELRRQPATVSILPHTAASLLDSLAVFVMFSIVLYQYQRPLPCAHGWLALACMAGWRWRVN